MPAKGKWDDKMRWGKGELCWSSLAQRQVEAIGLHMEQIVAKRIENDVFPFVSFRDEQGWNVSTILESALNRTARDFDKITTEMWQRYSQEYADNRVDETRWWHISQVAGEAQEKIGERLKNVFDEKQLYHAGKLNKKLIISMSLSYVVERIGK
jgi:hypothetical protein